MAAVYGLMSGFNTQPPEGGWLSPWLNEKVGQVSTHSRPKAAGTAKCSAKRSRTKFQHTAARRRLGVGGGRTIGSNWFQHTAARRRLER